MFPLNDDKYLDQASKTAADNYETPSNPNWEGLQSRLDKELPVKKEKRRRWLFLLFLIAGLTTSGSIIWYANHSKNTLVSTTAANEKPTPVVSQSQKQTATPLISPNTGKKDDNTKNSNEQFVTATEEENIPASIKETHKNSGTEKSKIKEPLGNNELQANSSLPEKIAVKSSYKKVQKEKSSVIATTSFTTNVKTKKNNSTSRASKKAIINGSTSDIFNNNKKDNNKETGISQDAITSTTDIATDSTPLTTNFVDEHISKQSVTPSSDTTKKAATIVKKNKSISKQAFSIALVTGADISTIKFKYGNKPGFHGGIIAGYHLNNKWSLHTGAIYTQNNYKLKGADYHPPKHYWTQYVKLETVEGYCRMWEIPVLIRYQFNPNATNRLFMSGGLSSYLMRKQQYDYSYKTGAGVPSTRRWKTDSSSNYLFSIFDLSAGWERSLGKRLNVQVEPYAKIPLKGVGFGNIRLSSFGINFSIQLRQPFKR